MRLLLHWFRWDLCRFRILLWGWVLLIVLYAVFLGWIHVHIRMVDPDWMDWSELIGKGLGIIQGLMLFRILTSDPAVGVDAFWKTRPPTGMAVAGSKLMLALGFFVVLPMTLWMAMNALCVPSGTVTNHSSMGISWTQFLWATQTLLVSLLAWGSAVFRSAWQVPMKLWLGLLAAVLPVWFFLSATSTPRESARMFMEWPASIASNGAGIWCWTVAGCAAFMLGRIRYSQGRAMGWVIGAIFPATFWLALWLEKNDSRQPDQVPLPNKALTREVQVHINGLALRDGGPRNIRPAIMVEDPGKPQATFAMNLSVALPAGKFVHGAHWRELRVMAPDGQVVEAAPFSPQAGIGKFSDSPPESDSVDVGPVLFDAGAIRPLSLLPLRAEGTLRMWLHQREQGEIRVARDQSLTTPHGEIYTTEDDFSEQRWLGSIHVLPFENPGGFHGMWIKNAATAEQYELQIPAVVYRSGFLIQSKQGSCKVGVPWERRDLENARFARRLHGGLIEDEWQLGISWEAPLGYVDVPVVLEPLVFPRQNGDLRQIHTMIAQVPLPSDATAEAMVDALEYVLMLANQAYSPAESPELVASALERWLQQVTPDLSPNLLDLVRWNLPQNGDDLLFDGPLTRRVAELIPTGEVDQLRDREPGLYQYLKEALRQAGKVTTPIDVRINPDTLTNEELKERWEKESKGRSLPMDILEEAVSRGLPWSMQMITEGMALRAHGLNLWPVFQFMHRYSPCPEDPVKATLWLTRNARHLQWDAESARWTVDHPRAAH